MTFKKWGALSPLVTSWESLWLGMIAILAPQSRPTLVNMGLELKKHNAVHMFYLHIWCEMAKQYTSK